MVAVAGPPGGVWLVVTGPVVLITLPVAWPFAKTFRLMVQLAPDARVPPVSAMVVEVTVTVPPQVFVN